MRLRCIAVACALTVTSSVSGQTSQQGVPNPHLLSMPKAKLLGFPAVQDEIEMTPKQRELWKSLTAKLSRLQEEARSREVIPGENTDPDSVALLARQSRASFVSAMKDVEETMLPSLSRAQRARLNEIQLQAEGPTAFFRPEFQAQLNLAPEQTELIRTAIVEARAEIVGGPEVPVALAQKAFIQTPGERVVKVDPKYAKQVAAAREATAKVLTQKRTQLDQLIGKLLTKKQRAMYRRMLGEPFDLAKLKPPPRSAATATKTESKR
jgi:hypothetical protein